MKNSLSYFEFKTKNNIKVIIKICLTFYISHWKQLFLVITANTL